MIVLHSHGEGLQATQDQLESDCRLETHRNIKKKKKSHRHRLRSRDRPRHKCSPISKSSEQLSESSSRTESPVPPKSGYEMCQKPSRGLLQRAFLQLNKHRKELAPQRVSESVISALQSSFCFVKTNIHKQTKYGDLK